MFTASLVLSGIYMLRWRKHYDVHITLIFTLIPIMNLGYLMFYRARQVEVALNAAKIIYIGGCFLGLVTMLTIFSLCGIRLRLWIRAAFLLISAAVYTSVLTVGESQLFYRSMTLVEVDGRLRAVKEYGVMHTVFQVMILCYFALSIGAIVFCLIRRNQVSRKILLLLLMPEAVCLGCYFCTHFVIPELELTAAGYVVAQICYLLISYRISLYKVADIAAETMVLTGNTAFISFDMHFNYLGCNASARRILPELNQLTVDLGLKHSRPMRELLEPWLQTFRDDPDNLKANRHIYYTEGDRIYQFTVNRLTNRGRQKGYEIIGTDNTLDQQHINLLNSFNEKLEAEVQEKTEHIVEMHNNLVLGMATMVESRDNSTGGHIRRTSEGVRLLTEAIRKTGAFPLEESFRRNLIKAAPMHDLGKIAVDDAILRKPGRFTPEEFEQMKKHAAEGARIVHRILEGTDDDAFHVLAENVAHFHHERWDGSGYPEGRKGEEIPLEARIMAVADVYDALVSKRVYKEKMSFEKAHSIIMDGMGSQFDPAMERVYLAARPALEAYYTSLEGAEK